MISLLEEKPFADLNVRAICDRAEINRTTFYKHYASKDDLLDHYISWAFSEMFATMPAPPPPTDLLTPDKIYKSLFRSLDWMRKNRHLFRVLLQSDVHLRLRERFRKAAVKETLQRMKKLIKTDSAEMEQTLNLTVIYNVSAYSEVLFWWIENDCQLPTDFVARHITGLRTHGTRYALEGP